MVAVRIVTYVTCGKAGGTVPGMEAGDTVSGWAAGIGTWLAHMVTS